MINEKFKSYIISFMYKAYFNKQKTIKYNIVNKNPKHKIQYKRINGFMK